MPFAALATAIMAAIAPPFDFQAIEFAPAGERLPAAQAFIAADAAPGTPLSRAIASIERAKARCHRHPASDGAILCDYARPLSRSASEMPIGDVTWTVRLLPTPAGTVARATVDRQEFGG